MKILIDGYWWNEGHYSNRMVLLEIVRQWSEDYLDDEIFLAIPRHSKRLACHPTPPGVHIVRTNLRIHPVINSLELPGIARRHKVDAILTFNFAAISSRCAVFIHDVLFQSNPEWFTATERLYFSMIPALARAAGAVITTSKTERLRIAEHNTKLRRVISSGLAVPTALLLATSEYPGLGLSSQSFILCVGRVNVRKNLVVTMRALLSSGLISKDFPVVIVGEPQGRAADFSEFTDAISDNRIVVAGHVPDNQLKWLYTNCRLFVCAFLDEGFGLPPVEAATLGAQVLVSNIPIFRETLGSYGHFVDPNNPAAISACVSRLIDENPRSKEHYIEQYNWRTVCRCIRDELRGLSKPDVC